MRYLFFIVAIGINLLCAVGTPAGTTISNTATVTYKVGASSYSSSSNTHSIVVDQIIELDVVCNESDAVIALEGASDVAAKLVLANTGNGNDTFELVPETNGTSPLQNLRIYVDNGDGYFNLTSDTQATDLNLSADANVTLFLVADVPDPLVPSGFWHGIRAKSKTGGSGVPGTSYNLGSYEAVDGFKGGVDSDYCAFKKSELALKLRKSATISSKKLYPGSVVTYTIQVTMQGYGTISDVNVSDVIPSGTTYVVGSLKLDGSTLGDSAHFDGTKITVPLGDMTRTGSVDPVRVVEFKVKVDR